MLKEFRVRPIESRADDIVIGGYDEDHPVVARIDAKDFDEWCADSLAPAKRAELVFRHQPAFTSLIEAKCAAGLYQEVAHGETMVRLVEIALADLQGSGIDPDA